MTDLSSLLARAESATGSDRELARDIWEALTGECTHRNTHFVELENDERELECSDCGADTYGANKWSAILSSLDSAIALCERALPGWRCGVRNHNTDEGDGAFAWVNSRDYRLDWEQRGADDLRCHQTGNRASADANTMPIALCAAIIKARMET